MREVVGIWALFCKDGSITRNFKNKDKAPFLCAMSGSMALDQMYTPMNRASFCVILAK